MKPRTTMAGREAALKREIARKVQQARKKRRPQPKPVVPPLEAKRERISDFAKKVSDPATPSQRPRGKPSPADMSKTTASGNDDLRRKNQEAKSGASKRRGAKPDAGKMAEEFKKFNDARKKGPKVPPAPPRNQRRPPMPQKPSDNTDLRTPGPKRPSGDTKLRTPGQKSTRPRVPPAPPRGPRVPPAPPRGPIGSKKAPPTPRMPTTPRMPPKPKVDPNRFISVADFERSGGLGKGPAKGTPKKPKQEPVMVPSPSNPTVPLTKTSKGGMYDKYPQRPGDFKKGGTVGGAKKKSKAKIRGAGIERKGLRKAKMR